MQTLRCRPPLPTHPPLPPPFRTTHVRKLQEGQQRRCTCSRRGRQHTSSVLRCCAVHSVRCTNTSHLRCSCACRGVHCAILAAPAPVVELPCTCDTGLTAAGITKAGTAKTCRKERSRCDQLVDDGEVATPSLLPPNDANGTALQACMKVFQVAVSETESEIDILVSSPGNFNIMSGPPLSGNGSGLGPLDPRGSVCSDTTADITPWSIRHLELWRCCQPSPRSNCKLRLQQRSSNMEAVTHTATTLALAMPATTLYVAPAPVDECVAPVPAVYAAPAPVVENNLACSSTCA